tara:strand:- start:133 stop:447 length:315 start_codon:yes stop_codon:yes gene_type:complete
MNIIEKIKKYDKISFGLTIGLLLPVIGFVVSYFIKAAPLEITFGDYFTNHLLHSEDKMDIIIFSMIPNMFLFYFVNFKWAMYEFTKGIVGITLVMGILVVISGI